MSWLQLIPIAAVCSVPVTIAICELISYLGPKSWPPNYWW